MSSTLKYFFNFISLLDTNLQYGYKIFINNCHGSGNPKYATNRISRFVVHLKERMNKQEIVVSNIYNYLKPMKLFCEMNDFDVKWKKKKFGQPKEKKYADDRSLTIEKILKLLEYPDRRIKVIISTMISVECILDLGMIFIKNKYKKLKMQKETLSLQKLLYMLVAKFVWNIYNRLLICNF